MEQDFDFDERTVNDIPIELTSGAATQGTATAGVY